MTQLRTALTELAALSVTGVTANYDVGDMPDTLSRAQLPALLVLPVDMTDDDLVQPHGSGFTALAFSAGAHTVTYTINHLLLVAPVAAGAGMRTHLPLLIDLIDDYIMALSADVTLDDNLLEPAQVRVEPGTFTWGTVAYHGCAFHHTWVLAV